MMFSDCSGHLLYLMLKEQNLLTAFYDFSASLKDCNMICSREETAIFLQNVIQQYGRTVIPVRGIPGSPKQAAYNFKVWENR